MKLEVAEEYVRWGFGAIDWLFERRFDVDLEPADETRVKSAAKGLQDVQWKYIPWLSRFDGEMLLVGNTVGHVRRDLDETRKQMKEAKKQKSLPATPSNDNDDKEG